MLDRWLAAVVSTPGLTAIDDLGDAPGRCCSTTRWPRVSLIATLDGPIVDVGSGGGTPGIPLAASFPTGRSRCSRPSGASASSSSAGRASFRTSASSGVEPRSSPSTPTVWSRRRRWPSRPPRSSGACRSHDRAGTWSSGSGRPRIGCASRRVAGALESPAEPLERAGRVLAPCSARPAPDPAGLPAPHRRARGSARLGLRSRASTMRERPPSSREWPRARPRLRSREPEGRCREDDHRRQPRRLPRRGGRADPARRSRPAGERHERARPARERHVDPRPSGRDPAHDARAADGVREPLARPRETGARERGGRARDSRRRRALPRRRSRARRRTSTRSCFSTALRRSGRSRSTLWRPPTA